ncbi:MAG: hypothetical protein K5695_15700 [Oscillospiraceae bacterium]|nr:hypothetical protein [Oscillospiraceae bacterium]
MSTKTKAKKGKSVFVVIAVILMLMLIGVTVTANVIFSGDSVPMVGGYYLYLNDSADMAPDIPEKSLVFAKQAPVRSSAASTTSIAQGNKVLCYLPDGNLAPRVIYDLTMDASGETVYYPATIAGGEESLSIPRSNIIALCTWASEDLYSFVTFATSVPGLMLLLVVPCIILIALLLVKIARSGKEELDEDDFFFDESEVEPIVKKPAKSKKAPLFDPEESTGEDDTLEKKKSSISEHFSAKPVNENSPYQKAVQERTMKFKAPQQEDLERAKQEEEDRKKGKSPARPGGTQVFTPSEVEEAAKPVRRAKQGGTKRPAPAPQEDEAPKPFKLNMASEDPAPKPKRSAAPKEDEPAPKPARKPFKVTIPDDDPAPAPALKAEPAPAPKPEPAPAPAPKASEPSHFSSPNIDDILSSTYRAASSKGKTSSDIASSGSIDDLIAVLENERKKL